MGYKVVITDYYYPDLEEEKKVLADTGIEIVDCNGKCSKEEDVIKYAADADALITQFVPITRNIIENLRKCRVIVRYAIGLDIIDIEAATENEIMVANVPDYCIEEVADHALALMMSILRKVPLMAQEAGKGNWSYKKAEPLYRISSMSLGLIAFGKIARNLAQKARAIGFKNIYVFDPYFENTDAYPYFQFSSLEELLTRADVVSIHAPANDETHHMFNSDTLGLMKDGSYLVNTSRGALINEDDLVEVLHEGKLAGAALDVLQREEIDEQHPLLQFENVVITPHMSWYSVDSIKELQRKVAEQVKEALLDGKPTYWVNKF